jgi:hypothetical protein
MASGAALRDRHRWAVSICSVERVKRLCAFRASEPVPGRGPSPVRGVWDGFGLRTLAPRVSAVAEIDTPPGDTRISLRVESSAPVAYPESAEVELLADGVVLARSRWPGIAVGITLSGTAHHTSEKMRLAVRADVEKWSNLDGDKTLWISAIEVESDRR